MSNINDLRANHDNEHDHEAVVQRQMMANPRAYHLNYLSKWVQGGGRENKGYTRMAEWII